MGRRVFGAHDPSARYAGTSPARNPRRGGSFYYKVDWTSSTSKHSITSPTLMSS